MIGTMIENTLHRVFRKNIRRGKLELCYPSGRIETYGDGKGELLSIRIADQAAVRAIARDPAHGGSLNSTWKAA